MLAEANANPFNVEFQDYFFLYREQGSGMRPVHLCEKGNGKFFLTSSNNCEINRRPTKTLGFWLREPQCGAVPIYRLYQPMRENHFYTTSEAERDNAVNNLGYTFEATPGYVWTEQ